MFGVECSSGDTFTDGSTSYSMVSLPHTGLDHLLTYRHPCLFPNPSSPFPSDQKGTNRPTFPAP